MHDLSRVIDTEITAPTAAAVSLATARLHLRSLGTTEDDLVEAWVTAATQAIEEATGRQVMTATRELWLDRFPSYRQPIELPRPPLQSVSSVKYIASDGTLTNFHDGGSPVTLYYDVKAPAGDYAARGWVVPKYGYYWPTARRETGAVRIQYVCGYGDAEEDVPALIRTAIGFLIGHYDQNRAAVEATSMSDVPLGIRSILDAFKYSAYPRLPDPLTGYQWYPAAADNRTWTES